MFEWHGWHLFQNDFLLHTFKLHLLRFLYMMKFFVLMLKTNESISDNFQEMPVHVVEVCFEQEKLKFN